jgi:hypothetical protein
MLTKRNLKKELELLRFEYNRLKNDFSVLSFKIENPKGYCFKYVERNNNNKGLISGNISDIYFMYLYTNTALNETVIREVWIGDMYTENLDDIKYEVIEENKYKFKIKYSLIDYNRKKQEKYFEVDKKSGEQSLLT